jgi:hypothetical protein
VGGVTIRVLVLGCVLAALCSFVSAPAGAAGGVSISQNPVPVALNGSTRVTVRWTGQRPRTLVFVRICRRSITDPAFDEGFDCSLLSEVTPNGTPDGSGSAGVDVFRGPEPGGDGAWGCFAKGDQAPPGIALLTTCYVRVTNNVVSNRDDDAEVAYTITPAAGTGAGAPGAAVAGATTSTVPGPAAITFTG